MSGIESPLPILDFTNVAVLFLLQTNASTVGLGAILEQGGRVITYASYTMNSAEQQHNTERKSGSSLCVKAVLLFLYLFLSNTNRSCSFPVAFGSKDGRVFVSLTIGAYSFQIVYCKCSLHANALSHSPLHTSSKSAAVTSIQSLTVSRCSTVRSCVPANLPNVIIIPK